MKGSKKVKKPTQSVDSLLSQNVALMLLESYNYDKADAAALFAISSLMSDYAKEIGSQIKHSAESTGRAQANLLDAMLVADDYGIDK